MTNTTQFNDKQKAFMKVLKANQGKELTLAEISELAGIEIKTGSINTLLTKGIVSKGAEKKVPVTTYRNVCTYKLSVEETTEKIVPTKANL